jgi:integrase
VRDFRKAWADLCSAAGIPHKMLHDFRRTAARNFRRAGVAENVIMSVAGWKTASVFRRYDIVDHADVREALAKLEQSRLNINHDFNHDSPTTGSEQKPGRVQ